MGMFDYVEYKTQCPICKGTIEGFQCKDGPKLLKQYKPQDLLPGSRFYSYCDNCDTWVEFVKNMVLRSQGGCKNG